MTVEILDTDFQFVDYLYEFESFIWVDRYNKPGDFEIFAPAKSNNLRLLKRNYYLRTDVSEHMMIIEDIVWESSADSGDHVKVSGRSLESILDRRIVWGEYEMQGEDIQTEIFALLRKEIINGRNIEERKIPIFTLKHEDVPFIEEYFAFGKFKGDSLLKIVEDITIKYGFGWKIRYNEDTGKLIFSMFNGTDRTIEDDDSVKYVEFSPRYENIIESTYSEISTDIRNAMLIGGSWKNPDNPDAEEKPIYESIGEGSGLSRREMYHESNVDKSREDGEDPMTEDEYRDEMISEGGDELVKYKLVNQFDGKYETNYQFKYGKDFNIGDIVVVKDVFGHSSTARITEFIRSINVSNGEEAYPTFEIVLPEEE